MPEFLNAEIATAEEMEKRRARIEELENLNRELRSALLACQQVLERTALSYVNAQVRVERLSAELKELMQSDRDNHS